MKRKTLLKENFDTMINLDFFSFSNFGFARSINMKFQWWTFSTLQKRYTIFDFWVPLL